MTSTDDAEDYFEAFVCAAAPASAGASRRTEPAGRAGGRRAVRRGVIVSLALAASAGTVSVAAVRVARHDRTAEPPAASPLATTESTGATEQQPLATAASAVSAETTAGATTTVGAATGGPPLSIDVAVNGGRILLIGEVVSIDQRDSLLVGLRQLAGGGVQIDDGLRVRSGEQATTLTISIRVDDRVLFEVNSAAVQPEFQDLLSAVITVLQLAPHAQVVVVGHADIVGDPGANQALSLARAQAVADLLVAGGVPLERVQAAGKGSDEPVASNATAEGRRANRRIEIQINH